MPAFGSIEIVGLHRAILNSHYRPSVYSNNREMLHYKYQCTVRQ